MAQEPLVWEWDVGEKFAVLTGLQNVPDTQEIGEGAPRARGFPADAFFEMDPKFKKFVALSDNMQNGERMLVVSRKVKEIVQGLDPLHVEYLPVAIHNHKKKPVPEPYFIVHPTKVVDCIDTKASSLVWNRIDKDRIAVCNKLVLKPKAVDGKHLLFRPRHLTYFVMVLPELADALIGAGCTGLRLTPASRFEV